MRTDTDLQRFLDAQQTDYAAALEEISGGMKRSHWMWYVFPQISGLGQSEIARYYGIRNCAEAAAYLAHPVLGRRLAEISRALLQHQGRSAHSIFGSPDDLKLRSSMTLFASLPGADPVFQEVLNRFYEGRPDERTLQLLH